MTHIVVDDIIHFHWTKWTFGVRDFSKCGKPKTNASERSIEFLMTPITHIVVDHMLHFRFILLPTQFFVRKRRNTEEDYL